MAIVEIWDKNTPVNDDLIGRGYFLLKDVKNTEENNTIAIPLKKKAKNTGVLNLTIKYDLDDVDILKVTPLRAELDGIDEPDPYVVIKVNLQKH